MELAVKLTLVPTLAEPETGVSVADVQPLNATVAEPMVSQVALDAPYSTPVRRLDEASAAKRPVVREAL